MTHKITNKQPDRQTAIETLGPLQPPIKLIHSLGIMDQGKGLSPSLDFGVSCHQKKFVTTFLSYIAIFLHNLRCFIPTIQFSSISTLYNKHLLPNLNPLICYEPININTKKRGETSWANARVKLHSFC